MKADRDDAPQYFQRISQRKGIASVIPWLIGTIVTAGSLHILSNVVLQDTVQNLASQKPKPKETPQPIAEIYKPEPAKVSSQDWEKIVEEQAKLDAARQAQNRQAQSQKIQEEQEEQERKANAAISILNAQNFGEGVTEQTQAKTDRTRPKEIVVVGTEKRKSRYCPGGEGSLMRRNCKAAVELNSRN
ncbi:hypothetical protein [Pseudomonas anguilliseptica]|uniref:Uncharacterized protein n=1 Tax=Pseudomonas anguilliseptica TaxID=53406 RepID=A0A1H4PLQ1_PSEAG|nr:hypothetical protein [Pseudomonas anguilliseptica]SEC08220.1 hypothetical protein SAMN05421553_0292 [Pseudomonas anguilliseptica]